MGVSAHTPHGSIYPFFFTLYNYLLNTVAYTEIFKGKKEKGTYSVNFGPQEIILARFDSQKKGTCACVLARRTALLSGFNQPNGQIREVHQSGGTSAFVSAVKNIL